MGDSIQRNFIVIIFSIAGFLLSVYGTRPRKVETARHGHVVYFVSPQPLHFVLFWVVLGTVVFAIWGMVTTSLIWSNDRRGIVRRYWLVWVLGIMGLQSYGPNALGAGVGPGIIGGTVGILATWLYYRYSSYAHSSP